MSDDQGSRWTRIRIGLELIQSGLSWLREAETEKGLRVYLYRFIGGAVAGAGVMVVLDLIVNGL